MADTDNNPLITTGYETGCIRKDMLDRCIAAIDALIQRDKAGEWLDFVRDIVPVICMIDRRDHFMHSMYEIKKRATRRQFFRNTVFQCAFEVFDTEARFFKFTIRNRSKSYDLFSAYFFKWKKQVRVTVTRDDSASRYAKQAEASLLATPPNALSMARWMDSFLLSNVDDQCKVYGELYTQGSTIVLYEHDGQQTPHFYLIYYGPSRRLSKYKTMYMSGKERELLHIPLRASPLFRYYVKNVNHDDRILTAMAGAWFLENRDKNDDAGMITERHGDISAVWSSSTPRVVVIRCADDATTEFCIQLDNVL